MDPISLKKDWTPKWPATFFERSRAPVLLVACCQPPMRRAQDWSLLHRRKGMESGSPKRCRDVHVGTWDGDGIHLAWCQALFWFRLGWSGVKQPRGTGVTYVGGNRRASHTVAVSVKVSCCFESIEINYPQCFVVCVRFSWNSQVAFPSCQHFQRNFQVGCGADWLELSWVATEQPNEAMKQATMQLIQQLPRTHQRLLWAITCPNI